MKPGANHSEADAAAANKAALMALVRALARQAAREALRASPARHDIPEKVSRHAQAAQPPRR